MTLEKGAEPEPDDATLSLTADLSGVVAGLLKWLEAALSQIDRVSGHERCELLFCARSLGLDAPVVTMALERAVREILAAPAGTRSAILEIEDYLLLQRYERGQEWRREFRHYWVQDERYRGETVSTISALLHCVALDGKLSTDAMRELAESWFTRYELESSRMEAWAILVFHYSDCRSQRLNVPIGSLGVGKTTAAGTEMSGAPWVACIRWFPHVPIVVTLSWAELLITYSGRQS